MFPILAILVALCVSPVVSFIWTLDETVVNEKFVLSESYMFASYHGPAFLPNEDSYIELYITATALRDQTPLPSNVSVVFFRSETANPQILLDNTCLSIKTYSEIDEVRHLSVDFFKPTEDSDVLEARMLMHYKVHQEGLQFVIIESCPPSDTVEITFEGRIEFKNPYGYIPGPAFGILPFEASRMIIISLFFLAYSVLCLIYHKYLVPLHIAIWTTIIIATTESIFWFMTYYDVNHTGQPYCCPFLTSVIVSMTLETVRRTLTRSLLLMTCLGYGIVRPTLERSEWLYGSVLTVLYLVSSILEQVSQILVNDVQRNNGKTSNLSTIWGSVWWQVPSLLADVIFISWIYLALVATMRALAEYRQTYKLNLYKTLAIMLSVFFIFFSAMVFFMSLNRQGVIGWPWKLMWIQSVVWELLNFSALVTVCFIFKPSVRSDMLSYSVQVPTEDESEGRFGGHGSDSDEQEIELNQVAHQHSPTNDDTDDEFEFQQYHDPGHASHEDNDSAIFHSSNQGPVASA